MKTLPTPPSEAIALSNTLLSQIVAEIKTKGPLSFGRYMQLALYAPQLGYYQNAYQKFGAEGDFVTAPEISPLFSYCLANKCIEILADINDGVILEFGAGSGVMAADILCHLDKNNRLPKRYFILEPSAALQQQQYATILAKAPFAITHVEWLSALPETPIEGVILANEVLDAMPVDLYLVENSEAVEALLQNFSQEKNALEVGLDENGALCFIPQKATQARYVMEHHVAVAGWIKSLASILTRGAAILMDYGFLAHEYYHSDRAMGTLMCHYRHYTHGDPFFYPGLQDITAHVNFTLVAESAEENGFSVSYSTQATFLLDHELLSLLPTGVDEKAMIALHRQILKLTSPNEMGELFKVMVLRK